MKLFILLFEIFIINSAYSQSRNWEFGDVAPTNARTYYFDKKTQLWRKYKSPNEVCQYLNQKKYRVGNFPVIIDSCGIETIWRFKDCYDDTCLKKELENLKK